MMAIHPVLAQGFTMAMEAEHSMSARIERSYVEQPSVGAAGGAAVACRTPRR